MKKIRAHFTFFLFIGTVFFPMLSSASLCEKNFSQTECSDEICSSTGLEEHDQSTCDCQCDCHITHHHTQLFISQDTVSKERKKETDSFFSSHDKKKYSLIFQIQYPPKKS